MIESDAAAYYNCQTAVRGYAALAANVATDTGFDGSVANGNLALFYYSSYSGSLTLQQFQSSVAENLAMQDYSLIQSNGFNVPTIADDAKEHVQVFSGLDIPITYWSGASYASANVNWIGSGATPAELQGNQSQYLSLTPQEAVASQVKTLFVADAYLSPAAATYDLTNNSQQFIQDLVAAGKDTSIEFSYLSTEIKQLGASFSEELGEMGVSISYSNGEIQNISINGSILSSAVDAGSFPITANQTVLTEDVGDSGDLNEIDYTDNGVLSKDVLSPGGMSTVTFYDSSGAPTLKDVESGDGTSAITTYANGGSVTTDYSGADGTGSITGKDAENADGTSGITTYGSDGSFVTTDYSAANGQGNIISITNYDGKGNETSENIYIQTGTTATGSTIALNKSNSANVSIISSLQPGQKSEITVDYTISPSDFLNSDYNGGATVTYGDNYADLELINTHGPGYFVVARIDDVPTLNLGGGLWSPSYEISYGSGPSDGSGGYVDGTYVPDITYEWVATVSGPATALCFASGTLIRTAQGEIAVEDLQVGDIAATSAGAHRPITWLGSRTVDCKAHPRPSEVWPVRIRAGAFGSGLPERDLYLSPGHPVLINEGADEVLVPIMCLINGTSIARTPVDRIVYWHIELDRHDILLAEGLPAESFLDCGNRPWFENGANHALSNPDFIPPGLNGRCRPVVVTGPVVETERRRLDALFETNLAAQCNWPTAQILFDLW